MIMNLKFLKNKKFFIILAMLIMFITACSDEEDINLFVEIVIGNKYHSVSRDYLINNADVMSFPAVVRSSGNKPVETKYRGIELSKLFLALDIDITKMQKITFSATDGYQIVLDIEEIYEPNNVYLTFERDGEYLKSKEQGGNGPYQLVIRHDPFSQRWCKHVDEIIVE